MRALLKDVDTLDDDTICDQAFPIAFESGWRRDVEISCTGGSMNVTLLLRLDPV